MSLNNLEAIVFDFDGVLAESVNVKTHAFAEIYGSYGEHVVQSVVEYHLANGGVSRFEKFRYYHHNLLGLNLSEEEEFALGERFADLVEEAVVASDWVSGARQFLESSFMKVPLFIASGTPEDELKRIVERRNMAHYFKGVFGSPAKKEEILGSVLSDGRYKADRVLMIGDAMTDYDAAKAAGVHFVGRVPLGVSNPFPPDAEIVADLYSLQSLF